MPRTMKNALSLRSSKIYMDASATNQQKVNLDFSFHYDAYIVQSVDLKIGVKYQILIDNGNGNG